MLRSDQILATVEMIQKENLDVRTVTMGINLLDCRASSIGQTCRNVTEASSLRNDSTAAKPHPNVIPDLIRDPDGVAASVADVALTGGGNARQWQ